MSDSSHRIPEALNINSLMSCAMYNPNPGIGRDAMFSTPAERQRSAVQFAERDLKKIADIQKKIARRT